MSAEIIAVPMLRHRITLESPTLAADDAGGRSTTYTVAAGLWAEIIPISGQERLEVGRVEQTITHRIRMRYREGVTTAMRIRHGVRYFDIISAYDPFEDRKWLVCLAKETTG